MVKIGLSCYITGTQYLQQIKDKMNEHGMNLIRISFRESFLGSGSSRAFKREYVDWFLSNTDFTIIIEPNHIYPPNESGATIFRNNWTKVVDHVTMIAQMYANNPRIIIEPFNEYVSNDLWDRAQQFIDILRPITNCPLLFNKWNQSWKKLNDPLNKDYYSYHFYFNSWSVSGAISKMNEAYSVGIPYDRIINTEIGADYNEEGSFSYSEVQELNDFLLQCANLGIGNAIWQYQNIQNMDTYESLEINVPDTGEEPTPPIQYTLTIESTNGGTTNIKTGNYNEGTMVNVTAIPNSGFRFIGWTLDNSSVGINNPYTITMNRNHTLVANFEIVIKTYTLFVDAGTGGSVSNVSGNYQEGTVVQVTAIPTTGYEFIGWDLDEINTGNSNPYSVIMNSDHSLFAKFEIIPVEPPTDKYVTIDVFNATIAMINDTIIELNTKLDDINSKIDILSSRVATLETDITNTVKFGTVNITKA